MRKITDKKAVNTASSADKIVAYANRHKGKCEICNSPRCKELEDRYLDGESPYDLQREMGFANQKIYKHVKVFGLDKKRDNSTLAKVDKLIDMANLTEAMIDVKTYVAALTLRAKLQGEIVDKQEISNKDDAKSKSTKQLDAEIIEIINESEGSDRESDAGEASTG